MKRFLVLWFVLASSYAIASVLVNVLTSASAGLSPRLLLTVLLVTLVQSAVLHFVRPNPHASPDQHR